MKTKTFKSRPGFDDGIPRQAIGVYPRLTENQSEALEKLAEDADKPLGVFLRDIVEAVVEQMIPAH
jgi:hypothetical protein